MLRNIYPREVDSSQFGESKNKAKFPVFSSVFDKLTVYHKTDSARKKCYFLVGQGCWWGMTCQRENILGLSYTQET